MKTGKVTMVLKTAQALYDLKYAYFEEYVLCTQFGLDGVKICHQSACMTLVLRQLRHYNFHNGYHHKKCICIPELLLHTISDPADYNVSCMMLYHLSSTLLRYFVYLRFLI